MEIISIERSTYEELLTNFNSFVSQMQWDIEELINALASGSIIRMCIRY